MNAQAMKNVLKIAIERSGTGAQTRLAKVLDVAPSTVNKWVLGQTVPHSDRWPAIEEALGMTPGSLQRAAFADAHPELVEVADDDELKQLDSEILAELRTIRTELQRLGDAYQQLAAQPPAPPPPASSPARRGSRGARRAAPSSD